MIKTEEMARLRVGLTNLPGFDAEGLPIYPGAEDLKVADLSPFYSPSQPQFPRGLRWLCLSHYDRPGVVEVSVAFRELDGSRSVTTEPRKVLDAQIGMWDAATRDRTARWMAQQWRAVFPNLPRECTAPMWRWRTGRLWGLHVPQPVPTGPPFDVQDYAFIGTDAELPDRVGRHTVNHEEPLVSPSDDRRLPDGSYYVDALAMALAAVWLGAE